MKKYLLFFLIGFLLLINKPSNAQYQSVFGNTQTSWNIKHQQLFGDYTDSLSVIGDTIINGNFWKKLDCYTFFSNQPVLYTNKIFLKEDTNSGKVWGFGPPSDTTLKLIMDLSLNVGDTFKIYNYYYPVDSIYYVSGKKYVRFDLLIFYPPNNEKFTMIEGTGTNIGICYNINSLPGLNPYLLCQYKDYQPVYINADSIWGGMCKVIITNVNKVENISNVKIFPNPAQNQVNITIDFEKYDNFDIVISDIQGKTMLNTQLISNKSNNQLSIDISQIPQGIYSIKLLSKNFIYHYKFIKI